MLWLSSSVYTLWGYKPITTLSIDWHKLSNGNYSGQDRGTSEDVYESVVSFKGTSLQLQALEGVLTNGRTYFYMTCYTGEEIFGADIDYSSSFNVAVVDYGKIQSVSKGVFSMPLKLRHLEPSFIGSASVSGLTLSTHKYTGYSTYDIDKSFTINGTPYYSDMATDNGIFKAVFKQTTEQMKAIRRYLTSARTATQEDFDFSAFGVSKPFGHRGGGSGVYDVKIIDWMDMGRKNYTDWEIEITFARVS